MGRTADLWKQLLSTRPDRRYRLDRRHRLTPIETRQPETDKKEMGAVDLAARQIAGKSACRTPRQLAAMRRSMAV